jgi:hypothetical protein
VILPEEGHDHFQLGVRYYLATLFDTVTACVAGTVLKLRISFSVRPWKERVTTYKDQGTDRKYDMAWINCGQLLKLHS